jgi:hypothetical protein
VAGVSFCARIYPQKTLLLIFFITFVPEFEQTKKVILYVNAIVQSSGCGIIRCGSVL